MSCSIVTQLETYNGATSIKVRWINPVGGAAAPADPDHARAMIAGLGQRAKRIARAKLGMDTELVAAPTGGGPAPAPTANDLPF